MSPSHKRHQRSHLILKYRKNTTAQIGFRTRTRTLSEPAQLKCMSTCTKIHQKRHFIRSLKEKWRGPDWAPNAGTHFVQARVRQETSEEPLCTEIYRKNAAAQVGPKTAAHKIAPEPLDAEIYRKNAAPQSEHPDQAPAFTPTVRTPQC